MSTSSRRLMAGFKTGKPSRTPGKDKGGSCVKTDLKTWGAQANPYKLRGGALHKYEKYKEVTSAMNK